MTPYEKTTIIMSMDNNNRHTHKDCVCRVIHSAESRVLGSQDFLCPNKVPSHDTQVPKPRVGLTSQTYPFFDEAFLKSLRTERFAVRVLKALSIWSIQIFARLFSGVNRCSFLDSVENIGLRFKIIELSNLWPRDFPFGGTLDYLWY